MDTDMTETRDDARFAAVMARDKAADGAFVYAVTTTGVYCRPSCPSKRGRRENIAFFDSPAKAEQAGFRACKRCRPDMAEDGRAATIARACRLIEAADEAPRLDTIARAVGLSPYHFHRLFKAATGVTPKAYFEARRTRRVSRELNATPTVTEAIYGAGFNSNGRFYAGAAGRLGMTPGAYRKGGAGEAIRFALAETTLGALIVAATDKGIAAIALGDDPETLLKGLQDQFPKAELIGGDKDFEALVAKVVGLVEAPGQAAELPLDIRGTAFEERVWQALRAIPPGTTVSYSELAERIGRPSAVRAVARACAANRIAIAVPCHRVVRLDGTLSGYRWGVERKRTLIAREARG